MPFTWRSSVGRVVRDALPDHVALVGDLDRVADVEAPLDADDPHRQQRRAALAQRAGGARVDPHRAVGRLRVAQPELERRVAALPRREGRALPLAVERARQRVGAQAVGDDRRDPARRGHLGGDDLGAHAAGAERRGRMADLHALERLEVGDLLHERRAGVRARVAGVEAVGVGEQDEPVRADEHRDLRGEEVVVAEGDLVGGRRVVLVDDRHDAEVQQPAQGLTRVEVVRPRAHVEEREQHLRGHHAALAQQAVVDRVELALPHRAGRLQVLDRRRAHREAHEVHAPRDGPARDDDHLVARGPAPRDLLADAPDDVDAQRAVVVGDDGRAELDDEARHRRPQRETCEPPTIASSPFGKRTQALFVPS